MPEKSVHQDIRKNVRVRVNGLVVKDHSLLMVNLHSPVTSDLIWMPPGGGVTFGETLSGALVREVVEETGIDVDTGPLWYLHEVRSKDIHAVEFYFYCEYKRGDPLTGVDPEYGEEHQIIDDVAFIPFDSLDRSDIHPGYLRKGFVADLANPERQKSLPRFI